MGGSALLLNLIKLAPPIPLDFSSSWFLSRWAEEFSSAFPSSLSGWPAGSLNLQQQMLQFYEFDFAKAKRKYSSRIRKHVALHVFRQLSESKRKRRQVPKRVMTLLLEQLIFDILLRLPVKALIQFKSVCKSWNILISSPEFIKCHNQYNESRKSECCDQYLMCGTLTNYTGIEDGDDKQNNRKYGYMCMISSFQGEENPDLDSSSPCGDYYYSSVVSPSLMYLKVQSLLYDPCIDYMNISGPCNGLYCLEMRPRLTFGLINPSLREFKLLPPYDTCWELSEGDERSHWEYGFGFDHVANDYKVVAMLWPDSGWQAALYSLKSNSWKRVTMPYNVDLELGLHGRIISCFVNGCCHWLAEEIHDDDVNSEMVTCFDMTSETFRTIRFSPDTGPFLHYISTVGPFELHNGRQTISVLTTPDWYMLRQGEPFILWIMYDYEDDNSWSKMFRFEGLAPLKFHVVGGVLDDIKWWFYEQGELNLICHRYGVDHLQFYNSGTFGIKKVQFRGRWPSCPVLFAKHRESLVSLRMGNEFDEQVTSFEILSSE